MCCQLIHIYNLQQFIHTMDKEASIFVQWFEIEILSNILYVLLFRKKKRYNEEWVSNIKSEGSWNFVLLIKTFFDVNP